MSQNHNDSDEDEADTPSAPDDGNAEHSASCGDDSANSADGETQAGCGCGCAGGAQEDGAGGCGRCCGSAGCGADNEMQDGTDTTPQDGQASGDYVVSVRYGLMGVLADFLCPERDLRPGDTVIMKSERGIDHGKVVYRPRPAPGSLKGLGMVIRKATESDLNILGHIANNKEPEEMRYCSDRIDERKMDMKLAGIEHLFGSDKIIYYFLAEGRVDFRELVKDLARRYRTRIEMRQIGVRDEARMLSDYEHCGRELCCRTFMKDLEPVTMRMAKIQKSTLDPSKISGHCGRLMCCLRFEDEVYKDNKKGLPHKGDIVSTDQVSGRVINTEVLSQNVDIVLDDGSRTRINLKDITKRERGPSNPQDSEGAERQNRPPRGNNPRDNRRPGGGNNSGGRNPGRPGGGNRPPSGGGNGNDPA